MVMRAENIAFSAVLFVTIDSNDRSLLRISSFLVCSRLKRFALREGPNVQTHFSKSWVPIALNIQNNRKPQQKRILAFGNDNFKFLKISDIWTIKKCWGVQPFYFNVFGVQNQTTLVSWLQGWRCCLKSENDKFEAIITRARLLREKLFRLVLIIYQW